MPASRAISSAGVEIDEEVRVESGGKAALVEDDAGPAVAEDEPADHREPERRHVAEVTRHRRAAGRHTQVRPPDIGAEIEPVVDDAAVSGPGVVAAVVEHWLVVGG